MARTGWSDDEDQVQIMYNGMRREPINTEGTPKVLSTLGNSGQFQVSLYFVFSSEHLAILCCRVHKGSTEGLPIAMQQALHKYLVRK